MIEFGKTLRAAREAKGLTIGQIADTTHMTPNAVSELENEDFSHLPAPIYGRGFVKLYCAAVGLDPKPLLEEFMEILNGNRDVSIKERATAEVPAPPQEVPASPLEDAEPEPEEEDAPNGPAPEYPEPDAITPEQPEPDAIIPDEPTASLPQPAEHQGVLSQQDFFRADPEPVKPLPRPAFAPRPEPPAPAEAPLPTPAPAPAERTVSRYSTPIDEPQSRLSPLGPSYIRLGVLAALALTVLVLLVLGVRALYRTTSRAPSAPETSAPAAAADVAPAPTSAKTAPKAEKPAPQKATTPAAKKSAPSARTPQKIPALYVD